MTLWIVLSAVAIVVGLGVAYWVNMTANDQVIPFVGSLIVLAAGSVSLAAALFIAIIR